MKLIIGLGVVLVGLLAAGAPPPTRPRLPPAG